MTDVQWCRSEQHVHLRIWLAEVAFDYTTSAEAARNVIHDWMTRRWCAIELVRTTAENCELLPRLPCERLFLTR